MATDQENQAGQQESDSTKAVSVPSRGTVGRDLTTDLRRFDGDTLRNIASFDDVFKLAEESGIPIESIENFGDGFELLKDKNRLVGQPLVILQWAFSAGDFTDKMSVSFIVTEDGRKFIITDGSTGIRDQLRSVTNERVASGKTPVEAQTMLLCRKGLSVSEYKTDKATGSIVPKSEYTNYPADQLISGATFYLA